MAFETLSPRLLKVATKSLAHCRSHWGTNGYHFEKEISKSIGWQPTFFFQPKKIQIIAVEVADKLYPAILKAAAHDIGHFSSPITVYQACPLDIFQSDKNQTQTNLLKDHGFGIITVDDDGRATIQSPGVPLAQNISEKDLEAGLGGLTPQLRAQFRGAYDSYRISVTQGVQQASQIVEGLIFNLAVESGKKGLVIPPKPRADAADVIDALWVLKQHRASLGAARSFVKNHRNAASHPAKSASQAVDRLRSCKTAFLESLRVAGYLRDTTKALGFPVRTFVI